MSSDSEKQEQSQQTSPVSQFFEGVFSILGISLVVTVGFLGLIVYESIIPVVPVIMVYIVAGGAHFWGQHERGRGES